MLENYSDMLSIEDVMEILGVGKNATYDLFRTGEIPAFRLKKRWKIPKKALIDYINKRYDKAAKHGKP